MTTTETLIALRAGGYCVRVVNGSLKISPRIASDALREAVVANSEELLILADVPSDDAIEAIAERAYFDPPDFDSVGIPVTLEANGQKATFSHVLRQSVIVRAEGFPTMAFDPAYVAAAVEAAKVSKALFQEKPPTKKKRATQLSLKHHEVSE